MKLLTSLPQFQELLNSESDFIIYKHSSTCNISDKACRNVGQIIQELNLEEIYLLDVHQTENLKYEVADLIWVRHESPQVLIFRGAKLIAHASHLTITTGWFRQHLLGWNDMRK
jgi:bacillithiol system protein YtxJ